MEGFAIIRSVKWVEEGQKLVVRMGDGTVEVVDVAENKKWRFQRPESVTQVEWGSHDVFWLGDGKLRTLNGDGVIRIWEL